jgi:hypothetical protein
VSSSVRVAIVVVSALAVASCGGDTKRTVVAAPEPSALKETGDESIVPPVSEMGGGAAAPSPLAPDPAVTRFRREVERLCEKAGAVARVSASAANRQREKEMEREIEGLEAVHDALDDVDAPSPELNALMERYLRRLGAQIELDRRIARAAAAEDEHSVEVGMRQNKFNRDARNEIVRQARFAACMRARPPR